MSIFLISFFIALIGIGFLVGRKLFVLQKSSMTDNRAFRDEDFVFIVPDLEEIGGVTSKSLKKVGYITLVSGMRIYMISSNFLKEKYKYLKVKIREVKNKHNIGREIANIEKKEVNKFLKVVGEYKAKIKRIKRKIKEEEGLN